MRTRRITVTAAVLGALALPPLSAPAQAVTPSVDSPGPRSCNRPGPWVIGTKAVTIRSKTTTTSTAVGVLYKGQRFTVHKTSGNWHHITNKTTGIKGWVSGTYVYRDVRMCLN
ncbi:SH3 domain-containing protein [Streptomyces amakusaensis]|uniref:SH3 domain-containing protein n=1 Tax=Streptomyces amakusaensis TaxID=67271 RepID=A0ABW0AK26_9ACTN